MSKVLHVFYDFLPHINGSCVRSAGILNGQRARRVDVCAVTSPFQPGFTAAPVEEYQGIRVYRAYRPGAPAISDARSSLWSRIRKVLMFPRFVMFVRGVAKQERATLLHAHSTFYCAFAALVAGRLLRLPVVYEFRSIWEERAKSAGLVYRAQAAVSYWLETASLRMADHVVAINAGLKRDIVARGVLEHRVTVTPNGVDDDVLAVGAQLSAPTRVRRFGYVGTLYSNEGLDLLVSAFREAFPNERDVELVFYGTGPFEQELRSIVASTGDSRIRFGGRFRRDDVLMVYREIDCVVLPRRRIRLNETVTPLKPLEAMAFSRLVCVSNVGGLLEVVGSHDNAWVFAADDVSDLAATLRRAYCGGPHIGQTASNGRRFVEKTRAWSAIAASYDPVYRSVARSAVGIRSREDCAQ